jgi:hypothetical protein
MLHDDQEGLEPYLPQRQGNPAWIERKGQRTFNERHMDWEVNIDKAKARGHRCTVAGCFEACEDVSARLCLRHRNHQRRTGDPVAGNLKRQLLGPWIILAGRYLKQLENLPKDHVAKRQLVLARHWWSVQVTKSIGYEGLSWRMNQSPDTKWRRLVANITRHGIDTDKVLSLAIAFYIARELLPGNCAVTDQHQRHQVAKLVLGSTKLPLPSWHSQAGAQEGLGFRFMQFAGQRLQEGLGVFCGNAALAILGRQWGGYPPLEDTSPVSQSAAAMAVKRPRYRPL